MSSGQHAPLLGFALGVVVTLSLGWGASVNREFADALVSSVDDKDSSPTSAAAEFSDGVRVLPIDCASAATAERVIRATKLSLRDGPMQWELGVLKGRDVPLGSGGHCRGPTDAWKPNGRDTASRNGTAALPATCMELIEPLNPRVPLKNTETCAQHNRRWDTKAEFIAHMDHDEPKLRNSRVKFLASTCPAAVESARRKVFIDAGCRHYDSSTQWFRETYPGGKDFIVHAVDVVGRYGKEFLSDAKAAFHHGAVWNETGFMSFVTRRGLEADGYFHTRWEDMPSTPIKTKITTVPTIAFAPFLKARVREDDFVVVKMDIEGAEWVVLEHLAREGALHLIDEFFIECHHAEWVPAWPSQHSLADCHRMFNALRRSGIFAHEWY